MDGGDARVGGGGGGGVILQQGYSVEEVGRGVLLSL